MIVSFPAEIARFWCESLTQPGEFQWHAALQRVRQMLYRLQCLPGSVGSRKSMVPPLHLCHCDAATPWRLKPRAREYMMCPFGHSEAGEAHRSWSAQADIMFSLGVNSFAG